MKAYKEPTLRKACSNVMNEWKYMANVAVLIRENRCSSDFIDENKPKFTGIYKRLLEDPIEEVIREAKQN